MKELKSEWSKKYNNVTTQHSINLDEKSPENFIDQIKWEYINMYMPNSGIVLEVGAGSGRLLTRIGSKNNSLKLIGVDYIKNSSKLIKENIFSLNLSGTAICADAFHLPFKSNSVSVVLSGGLLEHFNETEIDNVVKEMVRVLNPHGLFYADIVPEKFSLCRPIILTKHGGYENNFSMDKWRKILTKNGLLIDRIFSGCIIPPNFYCWFRSGPQLDIVYSLKSWIKKMDNTFVSDTFGFLYYVFAFKVGDNK